MRIEKIKLINFKRFRNYEIKANEYMNILIGDNETGKSSILEAIDLVSSGSTKRIESVGLERLINIDSVNEYLKSTIKSFEKLPILKIELYLSPSDDKTLNMSLNGKNNSDKKLVMGLD